MWVAILEWLAGWILKYLAGKATDAVIEHEKQVAKDKEREVTNEQNVKKYEEATSRADRIRAATDLLNGVRRP